MGESLRAIVTSRSSEQFEKERGILTKMGNSGEMENGPTANDCSIQGGFTGP
jgi:hypothetical protein